MKISEIIKYKVVRISGTAALFALLIVGGMTIAPIYNTTNSAEATTGTATESTLTFTSTNATASVNLAVNDTAGTFATSTDGTNGTIDQRAKFSISTNNYTGYTLTVRSTSDAGTLTNGTTSISSISSSTNSDGFAVNRWGYLPSYYNSAANTTIYYPAPTTTATTLRATSGANANDTADEYTIALGLKADFTNASGTYTNETFILEYVANQITYKITFTDDTGDTISNMPSNTGVQNTSGTTVSLPSNVPTRTGYTFAGWCNTAPTNSGTVCGGTTFGSSAGGGTYGIDQTDDNTNITLYALWTPNKYSLVVSSNDGVSALSVRKGSTSGTATTCSKSDTTFTCSSLDYGVNCYLYPTFATGYGFSSWTKTDSTTNAVLGSTSTQNTYYKVGLGAGAITLTSTFTGYRITYNANGGSGDSYTQDYNQGSSDYLLGNSFTRANYYFKGWATSLGSSTVEYRAGQSITPTANMSLYAVWGSSTSTSLYNIVASLNYSRTLDNTTANGTGLSAKAGIKATSITKDNSGVFTYNASTFGTASDAATTSTIYLYRGILDGNLSGTSGNTSMGSYGDSANYPNYVKLGNTCWRIVRTTGSGGVKMIYNGLFSSGTVSNSCANATTNAQVTTKAFNGTSSTYRQIVRVGYTYNSTYATNTSKSGTIAQIFGTNSDPTVNDTRSDIKAYIEDTWYAGNMTAYTSILEPSAGYCNDRTMNTSSSWTTPLAESTNIASTYGTSGQQAYYFGAYPRNMSTAQTPSLTCGNKYSQIDRSTVDLYRYVSGSTGVSNQLKYPVALLTADEMSFAGSGSSTAANGSAYNANSFLRSGSVFWLLSPNYRYSGGYATEFSLYSNGNLSNSNVNIAFGVRPAISLTSGTTASSGSGTATDPWVVTAP